MAVLPVLTYPHPALRQPADAVTDLAEARRVARDLVDTMRSYSHCVGLAAPQLGIARRVVAVDVSAHPKTAASHGLMVLVNPRIVERSGSEVGREGCMSLPDITANVLRAERVRFAANLPDGSELESMTCGFEARALLHEVDHLDGILILDRVASPAEIFQRRRR